MNINWLQIHQQFITDLFSGKSLTENDEKQPVVSKLYHSGWNALSSSKLISA
ncbi:MAG: hypothetical protein IPF54_03325 [Draconibacterium sp.]|nr:hypothetical protein [Draconibacterium sp.]